MMQRPIFYTVGSKCKICSVLLNPLSTYDITHAVTPFGAPLDSNAYLSNSFLAFILLNMNL